MEKRIFNQPNTIYRGTSRMGLDTPISGTRSFMGSQYNQRLSDLGRSFQTNNQHGSNYSSSYQHMDQRQANGPRSALMSLDRSKIVEYPVDIYPKSTLEDIRINYLRQAGSQLGNDNRSIAQNRNLGGDYQTNIQRSSVSNLRQDFQRGSMISEQNTQMNYRRPSPELDLTGHQRNMRENSPVMRVEYRRNSDNYRTSRNDRSPERNDRIDSRGGQWRSSPERYHSNNNSSFNSFSSSGNIPSLLDSSLVRMQTVTPRFVEPNLFTRREDSSAPSSLTEAERSLGYGSNVSSSITGAERSLQFKPPVSNLKGYQPGNYNPAKNNRNRPYVTDKPRPYVTDKNRPYITDKNKPYVTVKNKPYVTDKNKPYVTDKNKPYVTDRRPPGAMQSHGNKNQRPLIPAIQSHGNKSQRPFIPAPGKKPGKPGPNITGAKQTSKPVSPVKQGSTPPGLQNRKRKGVIPAQITNENTKKPKFESPVSNTQHTAEVTKVPMGATPGKAGTSEASVPQSATTPTKKKKNKKKNKPVVLDQPQGINLKDLSLVVLRNFPLQKMTAEQTTLSRDALMQEIEKIDDESRRPQFASCYRRRGSLVLFCKNDDGHEWLKKVAKTLEPWDGASFRVIRQGPQSFKWTVIALDEFPEKNMTFAQLGALEKALVTKMDEVPDETHPHFVDCYHRRGTLMVAYNRQEDFEWLKNVVAVLQPFEGAQLRIVDINDMPMCNKIEMWVPFPPKDIDKVLVRLDRQNTGLNTKNWYVVRHRQKPNDTGHTLILSVGDDVIEALEKIDFKPFLNFNRITVTNGGKLKNAPFTESEYEQDLKASKLLLYVNKGKKAGETQSEEVDT